MTRLALFYTFGFLIANALRITLGRAAFQNGADIWNHLLQVTFFSAIFLTVFLLPFIWRSLRDLITKQPKLFLFTLLTVAWHFGIGTTLSMAALNYTAAPNGSLIPKIHILFVVIWEYLFFKRVVGLNFVISLIFSLTGLWLISTGGEAITFNSGDLMLVLAAFMWSVSDQVSKILMNKYKVVPEILSFLRPFGFLVLLPLILLLNLKLGFMTASINPLDWPSDPTLGLSVLAAAALTVVWIFLNRAYKIAPISSMSLLSYFEALLVIGISAIFLNEQLGAVQLVGGTLIVLGTALFILKGKRAET